METNGINEKLQAQLIEDKRGSHSRTFALIALALIGLSIYIVWRVKQPAPPDAAPPLETEVIPIGESVSPALAPAKSAPKKELSLATALPPDDFTFAPATPALASATPVSATPASSGPAGTTSLGTASSGTVSIGSASPGIASLGTASLGTASPIKSSGQMPVLRPDENEATLPALDNFLPALPAAETAPRATTPRVTNEAATPTARPPSRSETVKPKTVGSFLSPENPASQSATETIHVIRDGDSLPELAAKYYGSATAENIRRLRDANPHLKRGGFREGVPLKIPAAATVNKTNDWDIGAAAASERAAGAKSTNAATLNGDVYTVVGGDTLSAISARFYGTAAKWQEIYALNRDQLSSPNDLQVGMKLKMPQKKSN
ncbi:MAG: LysM peptidoglycan-binding domain-containing protein [Planctomycetota bacterium]|jgi:nucleoid-associated protein YgaU|nr:LysM peptidoglycan-binding domain-containing protein [Planctomycetota bacterium]